MALVATWLIVLAPTTSRAIGAMAMPMPMHAHAHGSASMAGMHHHGMDHASMPEAPRSDESCDAACGYCTLFAQQPALAGGIFIAHALPPLKHAPGTAPAPRAGPPVRLVHAPARGPPSARV